MQEEDKENVEVGLARACTALSFCHLATDIPFINSKWKNKKDSQPIMFFFS